MSVLVKKVTTLDDLRPKTKSRVMDVLAELGFDVSDWKNYKKGPENASSNPKYCYEWNFVQPGKRVVLNLWWEEIQEENGLLIQRLNYRELGKKKPGIVRSGSWLKRARNTDFAVQKAVREGLPIRVIICSGSIRDQDAEESVASKVKERVLDPEQWGVESYNWDTGDCLLVRGIRSCSYVDQYSIDGEGRPATWRSATGKVFNRDPEVRIRALARARGKCQICGCEGFRMESGKLFLETHHVVPLSEDGLDDMVNVVALCPNHHREAHYGENRHLLKLQLLALLENG